jgi:hypothetical protein
MTATFDALANTNMSFDPGQKNSDGSEEIIDTDLGTDLHEASDENGPDRPTIKQPASPDELNNA